MNRMALLCVAALISAPAQAAVVEISGFATVLSASGTLTTVGDSVDPVGNRINLSVTIDTDVSGYVDLLAGIDPATAEADFHYNYTGGTDPDLGASGFVSDPVGTPIDEVGPFSGNSNIRLARDVVDRADLDGIGAPYDTYPDGDYSVLSIGGYAGSESVQDPVTGEFSQTEPSFELRFDIYRPLSGGLPALGGGAANVESWFAGQTVILLTAEEDDGTNGIVGSFFGIVDPANLSVSTVGAPAPVPLPATAPLALLGFAALALARRKRT